MDEIELLRGFKGAAPAVTDGERAAARALLLERIEGRGTVRPLPGFGIFRLPRRRLTRAMALAVAALVVAGSLSMVGALKYFGEWGSIEHPATVAQLDAEIDETMAAIPLPAGHAYPVDALRKLAEPAGNLTLFAGVQAVQFHAMCAWTRDWLDGHVASDPARTGAAFAVIEAFPTWQAVADPRLADDSVRNEVNAVVAGAKAGDSAPVELLFTGLDCESALAR